MFRRKRVLPTWRGPRSVNILPWPNSDVEIGWGTNGMRKLSLKFKLLSVITISDTALSEIANQEKNGKIGQQVTRRRDPRSALKTGGLVTSRGGKPVEEALSHHRSDHRPDDRAGCEVGKPVDVRGNADSDVERVQRSKVSDLPVFRIKRDESNRHGEGHRRVRRWPAPEDSAAHEAEVEDAAVVGKRRDPVEHWVRPAGKGLVECRDERAQDRGLAEGEGGVRDPRVIPDSSDSAEAKGHQDRKQAADPHCREHERLQEGASRGGEIDPV